MNATMIYILFSFTGPTWHGSLDVTKSKSLSRCEAMKAQLEAVPGSRKEYKCLTFVSASNQS